MGNPVETVGSAAMAGVSFGVLDRDTANRAVLYTKEAIEALVFILNDWKDVEKRFAILEAGTMFQYTMPTMRPEAITKLHKGLTVARDKIDEAFLSFGVDE